MVLSQFDSVKSPVAVINREGQVLYRNSESLKISRCLKLNGKVLPYLRTGKEEIKDLFSKKSPTLVAFEFPNEYTPYKAAFFPLENEENRYVLLFFSPLLTKEPSENDRISERENGVFSHFLRNALYASLADLPSDFSDEFTVENACMFLNRLSLDLSESSTASLDARFTKDSIHLVLFDFPKLLALLSSLSLLFLYISKDKHLKFRLYCEKDCPVAFFRFFSEDEAFKKDLYELAPNRFPEMAIVCHLLTDLHWKADSFFQEGNDITVCFKAEKPLPIYKFKSKSDEEKKQLQFRLEELYHCIFSI